MGRVFNLAEVYGAIDQADESRLRREGQTMQNEKMRLSLDEEKAIRETAAASVGPDGMYDPRLHVGALSKAGRGDLAYRLKVEVDEQDRQIMDYIEKRLNTVTAATYPQLVKDAEEAGIDLPDQYDPAALEARAQEIKQRIADRWGPPQQVPNARPGTVGQENLNTGRYDILDYTGRGSGGSGGGAGTGRERIIDRIISEMGVPFALALELERRSQTMDPERFYRDVALVAMRQYDRTGQAQAKALEMTRALYPGWEPGAGPRPQPQPVAPPDENDARRRRADPAGIFGP